MNQKNVYRIEISWQDDAPKRVLSADEKICLEQAVNTIFDRGIEDYCKENPVYTALFEKAGLLRFDLEAPADENAPEDFFAQMRQFLKSCLNEAEKEGAIGEEHRHLIPLPDTLKERLA